MPAALLTRSPWTDRPLAARRLPADVVDVVRAYRTTEVATLSRSGSPVAWPLVTWYDVDAGQLVLTTSVAFGAKLRNLRRDPHLSMLFSDPTGSGLTDLPHVLVQGTATVDDELHVDPARLEEYWTHLYRRQPSGRGYSTGPTRSLFDWYFFRAVIRVTPDRVRTRAADSTPAVGAPSPRPARRDRSVAAAVLRELRHHRDAVVSWTDVDGLPWSTRVGVTRAGDTLRLHPADGEPLREGPASLLAHSHDDLIDHQRSTGALGTLRAHDGAWLLEPERVLPGISPAPTTVLRLVRGARSDTARYLERAGLARPAVPWEAYQRLAERARTAGPV